MKDSVGLVEGDESKEKRGIKRIRGCGRREREKDPWLTYLSAYISGAVWECYAYVEHKYLEELGMQPSLKTVLNDSSP